MDSNLRRGLVAEALGSFAIVYFGSGAVCVNYLTTTGLSPSSAPLHGGQPGLVGIALANGLILAAVLAVTMRISGSAVNPAITLMLWVFNRLDNKRTACYLAAQLAAALLAGACLRYTFADEVLRESRMGTPHLNVQVKVDTGFAFSKIEFASIAAGTAAEFLLTFFLVFAIFGMLRDGEDKSRAGLPAGLVMVAGSIAVYPLSGAAGNPARWFGTVLWESMLPDRVLNPWADTFVYLAGPILGALAAGLVTFRYLLAAPETETSAAASQPAVTPKPAPMTVKRR